MYVLSSRNVNVSVVIPWVELRSYSATPTVDGDRGDPIPDQAYIKKKNEPTVNVTSMSLVSPLGLYDKHTI